MIKKALILSIFGITTLVANPTLATANNANNYVQYEQEQDQEEEACTMMYVGKDIAEDNMAIVARSADASPRGMNLNFKITQHNELANKTITGQNGFEWKMPETTYRYISTPRNTSVHKGNYWEVSGINEKGVNVTATLSCGTNKTALDADPQIADGLGEDNLTQIISATSATAREGIQTVASIVDEKGSCASNAIMVQDKNECWYMELYTGHQYLAIKLPDDQAFTLGNEFMLNTIHELTSTYNISNDNIIKSDGLFSLPKEKEFAKYESGHEGEDEYMDMFLTYSSSLSDGNHMRTWRGFNLFAKDKETKDEYKTYQKQGSEEGLIKYTPFFQPTEGTKLGINDVIRFMRDRFENILADGINSNYWYFHPKYIENKLRWVGVDTAYQVHLLRVNPNLPEKYASEEWVCLSNANHAPFIPLSNGINSMNEYYTHVTEHYSYDEKSAVCIFKRLNSLADSDRECYGRPIQQLLVEQENVWQIQYKDLINQVKDLSEAEAQKYITNYTLNIEKHALWMSKVLFDELNWHIMNLPKSADFDQKSFKPLIDIEYFAKIYGWNYERKGNNVTLKQEDEQIDIDLSYLYDKKGKITKGDQSEDVRIYIMDNIPYIDYFTACDYISNGKNIAPIDLKLLETRNDLVWIIPLSILTPIVVSAAILTPIIIINKRKKAKAIKK